MDNQLEANNELEEFYRDLIRFPENPDAMSFNELFRHRARRENAMAAHLSWKETLERPFYPPNQLLQGKYLYVLPSLRFRAVGCGVRRAGPRMRRAHIYA